MKIESYQVCLSIQRALLDVVTPSLRRVSFQIDEQNIILNFFYDHKPSELEEDLAGDAEAEVITDFVQDARIQLNVRIVEYPEKIPSAGHIVYNRYEKDVFSQENDT